MIPNQMVSFILNNLAPRKIQIRFKIIAGLRPLSHRRSAFVAARKRLSQTPAAERSGPGPDPGWKQAGSMAWLEGWACEECGLVRPHRAGLSEAASGRDRAGRPVQVPPSQTLRGPAWQGTASDTGVVCGLTVCFDIRNRFGINKAQFINT